MNLGPEQKETPGSPSIHCGSRLTILILSAFLAGACILYFAILSPDRFGVYHDDGIYVTTAKALATGQGYRIISLPYEPEQTKYPPFYPFLLSLVWRLQPQFPQNITSMMLLSIAATVSFLAMTRWYLLKYRYATNWQALTVVLLAAINWRTIIATTSVYSEMVYASLSVGGLILAEKYESELEARVQGVAVGLVTGLAFLTRSSGISLLIAVGLYYWWRKRWRKGLLPLVVGGAFVLGWAVWCYMAATTFEGVNATYYTSYLRDFRDAVNDLHQHGNVSELSAFVSIVARNVLMLILISPPVVCLALDYSWTQYFGFAFVFIAAGFLRQSSKGLRLLHLYIISYMALHILWLPYVSYDRFLIPLLPFLLLFLVTEIQMLTSLVRRGLRPHRPVITRLSATLIGGALLAAVGVALYNYGSGISGQLASASMKKTPGPAPEDAEAIEWIKTHTDPSDVVLCYRDGAYYLYTGRKATRSFAMKVGVLWAAHQSLIFRIVDESNARYLVATSSDFESEYQPHLQRESFQALLEQHRETFVPVFESSDRRARIYRIDRPMQKAYASTTALP